MTLRVGDMPVVKSTRVTWYPCDGPPLATLFDTAPIYAKGGGPRWGLDICRTERWHVLLHRGDVQIPACAFGCGQGVSCCSLVSTQPSLACLWLGHDPKLVTSLQFAQKLAEPQILGATPSSMLAKT